MNVIQKIFDCPMALGPSTEALLLGTVSETLKKEIASAKIISKESSLQINTPLKKEGGILKDAS